MKKKYSSKLAWIGATLCAFLLVACGLKVVDVTLSADEIEQGEEVTVTAKLMRAGGDWGNNTGIYLLYAIRVPSDWNDVETLNVYSNGNNAENNVFTFEESSAYSALSEFCYPQEGYKWIAFQTTEAVDLKLDEDEELFASLKLRAGDATGEFHLDILSGSMSANLGTPSDLLKEDGSLNLALAFGQKNDGGDADKKTLPDGTSYIGFSEYIVNASTISPAEREERAYALLDYKVIENDVEYSIAPYDLGGEELTDEQRAEMQLTVTVKEKVAQPEPEPEVLPEIAELISIDGGMIDSNYISGEDDLTITFDIPEGYDIWYCLSTDGASVRRKAHGEEGEHDGFEKYEADKAIELTGEHKLLECFVCNPETGNHSEIARYTLDIATGVFEIGAEWTNNAPVYNLKGQRVYDTTAPGIYIKNGKKFIVK